jgi:hypothetical protein
VFTGADLRAKARMAAFFSQAREDEQAARDALSVGQIVHYHDSFGRYLRCEVVLDDDGEKAYKPLAMVGDWGDHDTRGRVMYDATISYPYDAQKVMQAKVFKGRADSVYESDAFNDTRGGDVDPRSLDPIEIVTPDITPEDEAFAAVYKAIRQAENLLTGEDTRDQSKAQRADAARLALADAGLV